VKFAIADRPLRGKAWLWASFFTTVAIFLFTYFYCQLYRTRQKKVYPKEFCYFSKTAYMYHTKF